MLRSPSNSQTIAANATATTQGPLDNSTAVATDAFVANQIIRSKSTATVAITGGTYNLNTTGSGLTVTIGVTAGVVTSITAVAAGGSGYAVGDVLVLAGNGNVDAIVQVTNVSGGVVQAGGVIILSGGTSYTNGVTLPAVRAGINGGNIITLTGTLTSNATIIFVRGTQLSASSRVIINNNTTGAFTVSIFMSNGAGGTTGTGVVVPQGFNNSSCTILQTDGVTDVWLGSTTLGEQNIRTITTSTTLLQSDYTVLANATGGAVTVTLPASASNQNRIVAVKKIDASANTVTVKGNGAELIDGSNTNVLSAQYAALILHNDRTQWWVV